MGTVEVFTVGGGEYLVNVFNAIAAWCGSGGYRSLLRVIMVMGFTYALLATAWNMDPRALLKWFMQATLMYLVLMVPTATVKITDRTNPSIPGAAVANVPIGLAGVASLTSQIGDYLTTTAETVFVMPSVLNYSSGGLIYGAKLMDAAQGLRIDDPTYATNLNEHFKQCVFYDVLLGRKRIEDIVNATDMLAAMGPGSVAQSQVWIASDGSQSIIQCDEAYQNISNGWHSYYNGASQRIAKQFFPGVSVGAAQARFQNDVGAVGSAALGSTTSSEALVRQAMLVNAMSQARDNFGSGYSGGADAFAATRADIQTRNTYSTIAAGAMKWVPLLNIVLTVVFYAMFPIIFLLTLMPQTGIGVIKGYITGFFYLSAWGPLFVVLNMIFMTRWQSSIGGWSSGGLTAANFAGIASINQDAGALAGYMIMSVPFIAAGMAKGAMSIASQSTSFLAPSQSAAEQAAAEQTTGNYAYGNRQFNNLTANQWNDAPSMMTGAGTAMVRNSDGTISKFNADGSMTYDSGPGISNLGFQITASEDYGASIGRTMAQGQGFVDQKRQVASDNWTAATSNATRLADLASHGTSSSTEEGRSISSSLSQMNDLTNTFSNRLQASGAFTKSESDSIARNAALTGKVDVTGYGEVSGGFKAFGTGGTVGARASVTGEGSLSHSRSTGQSEALTQTRSSELAMLASEAQSDQARSARDSFYRATSGSSDSRVRSLSQETQSNLSHAQTASTEASRAEENFKRIQSEIGESERGGVALSKNETQNFVNWAGRAMMDSSLPIDHTYRPGMQSMSPSQAGTQSYLLDKYMEQEVAQLRSQYPAVPESLPTTLTGPSATSPAAIRSIAGAGMDSLRERGPSVNTAGPGRDEALESEVGGRLSSGAAWVGAGSRQLHDEVGGRGGADATSLTRTVRGLTTSSLPNAVLGYDPSTHGAAYIAPAQARSAAGAAGLGLKSTVDLSHTARSMGPVMSAVALSRSDQHLPRGTITSGQDGVHHRGSLHYSGRALDFRGNDLTVAQGQRLAGDVRTRLGPNYDVIFETFADRSNNHLHVEYDPKGRR